ncbi:hypothetical protein NQZ68_018539 [Dissostichus eleginoides]|nr:hypothetical protein NQZ68_018539 [Dissostichus eleginoides]
MVSSSRLRLILRHFVNSGMGEMSSKAQMPTLESALPGRTAGIKVSETKKERGSKGGKGEAMPAVERLGRASPPLSAWLGAAAPEEIKKCPGVVVLVLEEEVDLDSEKDESEKVLLERPKNSSERAVETKKTTSDFLFF